MKQSGKTWKTPDGQETLEKYLPPHDRVFEKLGQVIASEAIATEERLKALKYRLVKLCKEAFEAAPDKSNQTRFGFYTFDHGYKIELDIKTGNVRVYEATQSNPSHKDYRLINMDFSRAEIVVPPPIREPSTKEALDEIEATKGQRS